MNYFYLNHNYLTDISSYDIVKYFEEINQFISTLRLNHFGLKIRDDLWKTVLQDKISISNYLHRNNGTEEATAIILGIMNSGPYFSSTPSLQPSIKPMFNSKFCEEVLIMCFEDHQENIISLEKENCLTSQDYTVANPSFSLDIKNFIGLPSLEQFFKNHLVLSNISDVFTEINKRTDRIKILPSAVKSSKQHNFHGRFSDVLDTLLALETIDLALLKEGVNDKKRMELFHSETSFKISGESEETLSRGRYEAQRTFFIQSLGRKELFEWHIKIGPFIRIHYYIDIEKGLVYIGHCGKHLDI